MTVHRILGACVFAFVLAGCSNSAPAEPPPGILSAGTAEISIDGANVETTHDVHCTTGETVVTVNTGNDDSGTTSAIDTADGLVVQFAQFRNVGGFTGSYWADLDPEAEAQISGHTFTLSGTANGFHEDNPSARISQPFSIKVAC
ncbi:lipoprotein LpqH [Mycolicibacterium sp. XJ1819]